MTKEIVVENSNAIIERSQMLDVEEFLPPVLSAEDEIGKNYIFRSYEMTKGDFGDYMLVLITDIEENQDYLMRAGGANFMFQFKALADANVLPFYGALKQLGSRSYCLGRAVEKEQPF